jgi:hypothetical protein
MLYCARDWKRIEKCLHGFHIIWSAMYGPPVPEWVQGMRRSIGMRDRTIVRLVVPIVGLYACEQSGSTKGTGIRIAGGPEIFSLCLHTS